MYALDLCIAMGHACVVALVGSVPGLALCRRRLLILYPAYEYAVIIKILIAYRLSMHMTDAQTGRSRSHKYELCQGNGTNC